MQLVLFHHLQGMMVDEAELGGMQLQLSESGERERERVDRLASPNGSRPGPGPGSLAGVRRAGPPPAKRKKGPIPRELSTAQLLRQLREGRAPTAALPIEDEDSAAAFSPIIIPLVPEDQQLPAQEPKLIPLEGSPVPSVSDLSTLNASTGSTPGTIDLRSVYRKNEEFSKLLLCSKYVYYWYCITRIFLLPKPLYTLY